MKHLYLLVILLLLVTACGIPAKHPITAPSKNTTDDRLIGKWMLREDTNRNNYYLISKGTDSFEYHIKFYNRGGTNRTYEADVFLSNVDGNMFINIPYWENPTGEETREAWKDRGYFFVRLIAINEVELKTITTATVSSKELSKLETQDKIFRYMQQHTNDKSIYTDTVHFIRLN